MRVQVTSVSQGETLVKCPLCGLENPPSALRCDCGFQFATGTGSASIALPQPRATATQIRITNLLLAAVFVVLVAIALRGAFSSVKWEYLVESPSDAEFSKQMNALGERGWELVSARRAVDSQDNHASYEVIMKRRKAW